MMIVSISRNSACGPPRCRTATSAPTGSPRYSAGNNEADTDASACGSPRHAPSITRPTPTNAASSTTSITGPLIPGAPSAAVVSAAAANAGTSTTSSALARASATSSRAPRITISSAAKKNNQSGAVQTIATARAMRTAPLTTRVMRSVSAASASAVSACSPAFAFSLRAQRDGRRLDAAVAALALLIGDDGLEQIPPPEIGPQPFGHPDLRVRDLPQQEVADPHL